MELQQSVTFNMSPDDQVAGAKLSALRVFRSPFSATAIFAMLFVAVIVTIAIFEQVESGELSAQPLLPLAPLVGLGLLIYFVTAPAAARRNFRHNKMLHHPIVFSWDAAGLDFKSNENSSRVNWPDLFRVMENRRVMLFFISPQSMFIVPKRVLTAAQIEQLRGYASAG